MPDYSVRFPGRGKSGWKPGEDPFLAADALGLAERNLSDFTNPLNAARGIIANDVQQNFLTESDPEGVKWKPWAESYFERATRENTSILYKKKQYHDTPGPQLYEAATKATSYTVVTKGKSSRAFGGGAIILNPSALPYYWVLHQEGGELTGYSSKGQAVVSKVPARPFLGVSTEAEAAITTAIDFHVEGTLAGAVTKTGQPIFRIPGVGATFGAKRAFMG